MVWPGEDYLMINPGFLLVKGCQELQLLLGKVHSAFFFLDLGQALLELQQRFPEIVEHGLQGVQSQDQGLLMLAISQQLPGPLQLRIGMINVILAIHGKTSIKNLPEWKAITVPEVAKKNI
jgi:hypothetical protein